MDHQKAFISIRYWLIGRNYHTALDALEFAHKFHQGTRKDGVTPEYQHQLDIAHFLRTLINHLSHPEETLAATFLHDTAEDADVGFDEINTRFGLKIGGAVKAMTKKHRGYKKPIDVYYREIGENEIASICKGGDRVNNIQTMIGVFAQQKQVEYMKETIEYVLPMLKSARRLFTRQEPAYENIKIMLRNQIALIQAVHNAQF